MSPDEIPFWFAVFVALAATDLFLQLEVRASSASSDEASDRPGR